MLHAKRSLIVFCPFVAVNGLSDLCGHSPKGDGSSGSLQLQSDIFTIETAAWNRQSLQQIASKTNCLFDLMAIPEFFFGLFRLELYLSW
jgi:hypothetical protein